MRLDVDEIDNDDLGTMCVRDFEFMGWDVVVLRGELHRVERVISSRVTTGDDLRFWFERQMILGRIIRDVFEGNG